MKEEIAPTGPDVEGVLAKARAGERLTLRDGLALYASRDLLAVGAAADAERRRRHGRRAYYRVDLNLNHTNVCVADCGFCAFYRKEGEEGAYTMTLEDIERKARAATAQGVYEWHIVGGLHPDLPIEWFESVFRLLKRVNPEGFIQALTAVEVDYIARKEKVSVRECLSRLKAAGLDMLPGGGAEVFDDMARRRMLAAKIKEDRWLAVHAEAHALGIPTNATMLYGHVETPEERVRHMLTLRRAQERHPGFLAFVPLAYNPEHTRLARENPEARGSTGTLDLQTVAVARLVLDNFDHVKLPWVTVTKRVAQIALSFGADDVGGAAFEERILEAAGGRTWELVQTSDLPALIEAAGFETAWVDSAYRPRRAPEAQAAPPRAPSAGLPMVTGARR